MTLRSVDGQPLPTFRQALERLKETRELVRDSGPEIDGRTESGRVLLIRQKLSECCEMMNEIIHERDYGRPLVK